MGYNISALEGQNGGRDWPLIVTAVECPTCGAGKGEMCWSIGTRHGPTPTNALVNTGGQRIDWHAKRKEAAAHAWYTRKEIAGHGEQGDPATNALTAPSETPGEPQTEHGKEDAATDVAAGASDETPATPVVQPSSTTKK